MSDSFTIYHNPRCSKSRQTLAILEENGIQPNVILYLKTPPSKSELKKIAQALGVSANEFIRSKEPDYKDLNVGAQEWTNDQLLQLMADHPKLIERPIVVKGQKAIIGRPPEAVLKLIEA